MSVVIGANSTDRIEFTSLARTPDAVTWLLWHYPTTITTLRRLCGRGDAATFTHNLAWDTGGGSKLNASLDRASGTASAVGNKAYSTNKWWLTAMSIAAGAAPKLYWGDLSTLASEDTYASSAAGTSGSFVNDSSVPFGLGNLNSVGGNVAYQGRIAVFARFKRVLTLAEILRWQFEPFGDVDCDVLVWPGFMQPDNPTLDFDASSESHTGTTGSTSVASFNWNHIPVGTPRGILVFTFTNANADDATAVSYGGVSMTAITSGRAVDTTGEPGDCKAWFLGSGIPTGTQSVVVTRTNNADEMYAVAVSLVGAFDTESAATPVLLQNDGTLAQQALNTQNRGVRFAGLNSGLPDPTVITGAASTLIQSIDFGARGIAVVRETTPGSGSRSVGFTSATSDDRAGVHVAIAEVIRALNWAPSAAGIHGKVLGPTVAPNVPLCPPFGVDLAGYRA